MKKTADFEKQNGVVCHSGSSMCTCVCACVCVCVFVWPCERRGRGKKRKKKENKRRRQRRKRPRRLHKRRRLVKARQASLHCCCIAGRVENVIVTPFGGSLKASLLNSNDCAFLCVVMGFIIYGIMKGGPLLLVLSVAASLLSSERITDR